MSTDLTTPPEHSPLIMPTCEPTHGAPHDASCDVPHHTHGALTEQEASTEVTPEPGACMAAEPLLTLEDRRRLDAYFGAGERVTAAPAMPRPQPRPAPTARPRPTDIEGPLDALLRDRDALLEAIEAGKGLSSIARAMLVTVVVCGAALGACVGMFRGGEQIVFAALKLPMVLLLTTAVCAPVYTGLKLGMRQPASLVKDFALLLSALALSSLVAASMAPLLLLAIFSQWSYHTLTLLLVMICGAGGLCGFLFFTKGLGRQLERAHRMIYMVFLCVLAVVSMQSSWLMRPYLVRPQTTDVPFMRAIEGSFFGAVSGSISSALGIYDEVSEGYDISLEGAYDVTLEQAEEVGRRELGRIRHSTRSSDRMVDPAMHVEPALEAPQAVEGQLIGEVTSTREVSDLMDAVEQVEPVVEVSP